MTCRTERIRFWLGDRQWICNFELFYTDPYIQWKTWHLVDLCLFPAVCNGRLLSTKSQTFRISRRISNCQRNWTMFENWFARPANEDIKIWAFKVPVKPHREEFIFANVCTNLNFTVRKIYLYWVLNSCKKLFLLPNIMTSKFYGFCKCQLLYVLIKSK